MKPDLENSEAVIPLMYTRLEMLHSNELLQE